MASDSSPDDPPDSPPPPLESLKPDVDYYLDEQGNLVFTAAYHQRRGYCCKSGCRHCPYGFVKKKQA